jgi:hypothetical protein
VMTREQPVPRLRVMTRLLERSTVLPSRSGCLQRGDDGRVVRCRSFSRRRCRYALDCWGRRPVLDRSVRYGPLAPGLPRRQTLAHAVTSRRSH